MKIVIKATNLKLTPNIQQFIEEKIGSVEKFIPYLKENDFSFEKGKPPFEAWVEIEKTTHHHQKGNVFRTECQIKLPGKSIRAESIKENLYLSIDEVKDELQIEIKKYRGKGISRYRKATRKIKNFFRFFPLIKLKRK